MSNGKLLQEYVESALNAGQSQDMVRGHLVEAGWSPEAIDDALGEWSEIATVPPVPRPRAVFSVFDLFLYLALLTALALSAFYMVSLGLGLIDYTFDPPTEAGWQSDRLVEKARWALAIIVVMVPLYGLLVRWTDRDVAANPVKRRAGVRRFAIGLTMLIAASVFAGDLVYVVFSFLEGDVTLAFLMKALIVAVVAVGVLLVGREDLQPEGGPLKRPLLWAGLAGAVALVVLTVLAIGSPHAARNAAADLEMLSDLERIATELQCPTDISQTLPEGLSRAEMAQYCGGVRLSFSGVPVGAGEPPYAYARVSDTNFTLCAPFHDPEQVVERSRASTSGNWNFDPETGCINGKIRRQL